jgi:hypothetical protein
MCIPVSLAVPLGWVCGGVLAAQSCGASCSYAATHGAKGPVLFWGKTKSSGEPPTVSKTGPPRSTDKHHAPPAQLTIEAPRPAPTDVHSTRSPWPTSAAGARTRSAWASPTPWSQPTPPSSPGVCTPPFPPLVPFFVLLWCCGVVWAGCLGLLCFCVVLWFGPRRAIGVTMAPHVTTVRLAAACGCTRHVGAGDACVDSGPSPTHGELGYGTPTEEVPRSSTVPKIVDQLEGARVRFLLYLPAA